MVTKTKLYALDLRSFTTTIEQLDEAVRANQAKLDDITHAKEIIASGMQGQNAQAMIAKLDALEQKITDHITSIQQTQAAITTYRTNKQQLQREVIDYVDSLELDSFSVSDVWIVLPSDNMLAALSPPLHWRKVHCSRHRATTTRSACRNVCAIRSSSRSPFWLGCQALYNVRRVLDYRTRPFH